MKQKSKVQEPQSEVQDASFSSDSEVCRTQDSRPVASNPQSWLCLSIPVPHEAAEAVASFLVELGSEGVIEGERDLTQPASAVTTVQGFFPLSRSAKELCAVVSDYLRDLQNEYPLLEQSQPRVSEIRSEAWAEQWRGHFPPLPVGQHFLVLPPWELPSVAPQRIALVIDPSMAFGTGHHATTQGCLEAIEMLCQQYGPPARALDLGTGSGILAIALAKLGTPEVWATDNDPIALEEAHKKRHNQSGYSGPPSQWSGSRITTAPLPLIVANLFSSTLVSLASTLTAAITSDGHAILSGIQLDQEAEVVAAYPTPMWQFVTRYPKDEWVTLVMQRT